MTTNPNRKKKVDCSVCGCTYGFASSSSLWNKLCACPTCGWMEEDTSRKRCDALHLSLAVASLVFVGFLYVAAFFQMAIPAWCTYAGLGGLTLVIAHSAVAAWNPNRSPQRNLERALQLAADGGVSVVKDAGQRSRASSPPANAISWFRLALLGVAAASVCAMVTAEVVRRQQGWVDNERLGVLGPGDTFTLTFSTDQHSIKGLWTGHVTPEFVFTPKRTGALNGLTGTTLTRHWGDTIGRDDEAIYTLTNTITPWATITLPNREELNWRSAKLSVKMGVTYPVLKKMPDPKSKFGFEKKAFLDESLGLKETFDVVLSVAGARQSYHTLWQFGGLGGAFMFLLANFGLGFNGLRSLVRS